MINYVYDDIKTRCTDGIHAILFFMDFTGEKRREKQFIAGDSEKVRCIWGHWHEEFEIIAMTGGMLIMSVEGTTHVLRKGDVLVIPPCVRHIGYCQPEGEEPQYFCMLFGARDFLTGRDRELDEEIEALTERKTIFRQLFRDGEPESAHLLDVVRRTNDCFTRNKSCAASVKAAKVAAVYDALSVIISAKTGTDANVRRKNLRFVNEVMDYISENYQFQISSGMLAERMNYEHTVFCRMFKENFGTNFSNYLREYRIRKALGYAGADIPISLISTRVGFDNYSYFSTSFREIIGMSPREYFTK